MEKKNLNIRYPVGTILKVRAGRRSSNGIGLQKLITCKVIRNAAYKDWIGRFTIDIKPIEGKLRSWRGNMTKEVQTVYSDAFEPVKIGESYEMF